MAEVRERDPLTGKVKSTTSSAARDRRERARAREEWARTILENDPTVTSMSEARERARELESETRDFESAVEEGLIDPKTGEPTRKARRARQGRARRGTPPAARGRKSSGRAPASRKRSQSFVRRTARTVTAPFGSGLSTGWTLFQGGLSLVLLYVVMRDADAVGDLVDGVTTGLRRFSDPYTPLLPRAGEVPTRSTRSLAAPKRQQRPAGRRGGYSRGGLPGPGSPNDPRIRR